MDQLPRLGKRELICLLLFTCNYVVFVRRRFLFLWMLGMGYVILLWHSLSLPYNYFVALKLGILIAKRSFHGKSMSSYFAFMPVAIKVGQKVKKIIFKLFSVNKNR